MPNPTKFLMAVLRTSPVRSLRRRLRPSVPPLPARPRKCRMISAYPISTFTWLLIPEKFSDAAKRDAMKGFVKWMLADGQNYAEALSYAKLPKEVVSKEVKAIEKIQ